MTTGDPITTCPYCHGQYYAVTNGTVWLPNLEPSCKEHGLWNPLRESGCPDCVAEMRRETGALNETIAALVARVRYYESGLCVGDMIMLPGDVSTEAVDAEVVAEVLRERDELRAKVLRYEGELTFSDAVLACDHLAVCDCGFTPELMQDADAAIRYVRGGETVSKEADHEDDEDATGG